MADNYTVYENLYNFMNYLLNPVQGTPGSAQEKVRTASAGKTTESRSFAEAFRNEVGAPGVTGAPQSMDTIFEEAAALYDVPVQLLKAVGKAESGFDANAVSAVGAQGVMQLMPETARYLGVDDPFDARSNIMGGAKYIAEKLKEYDGDVKLALASYNAGSGNVAKYGGVPPFTETINYIERIMGYMGTDLTTGKTVETSSGKQDLTRISGGTEKGYGEKSISDVMSQYYLAQMQLKLQDRINDLGQSLASEGDGEEEEEKKNYFL